MRILMGCLLLGCSFAFPAVALLAPDSEALHKLYGKSDLVSPNREGTPDSESFHLRDDIHMTVMYGLDHHACFIELTPEQPLYAQRPYHEMSSERVTEILEEIAPSAKRGKLNGGGTTCAGRWESAITTTIRNPIQRCISSVMSARTGRRSLCDALVL